MALNDLLRETLEQSNAQFPPQALEIIESAAQEMRERGIEKAARGVGDYFAHATLKDASGKDVSLADLNATGPMIVSFYRGGWCPYCNLELKAYQDHLQDITALGGQLIAISPEKPDAVLSTVETNALGFPVLTDEANQVASAMGIAFELPAGLQTLFGSFGMDLPERNANTGWALPVPATYVVDGTGRIALADVDVDYTRRLEPAVAINALKSIACKNRTSDQ